MGFVSDMLMKGEGGVGGVSKEQREQNKAEALKRLKRLATFLVCVTQPRRVAATTVARRVASEMGCKIGDTVGYRVRFDDTTSHKTRLIYMTDGLLLREAMLDPLLSRYGVVVLDEAHERTLHTDVLFALLKQIQEQRAAAQNPLRIVIMSATLDARLFSDYFDGAPILKVSGRTFPVDVMYTHSPEADYVDAAIITTLQLHLDEKDKSGGILVFLTGQEEIEDTCRILRERADRLPIGDVGIEVYPIYASLPPEKQLLAFQPAPEGKRKVVVATNIAETSLTIDGLRYVIDTGLVKQRGFAKKSGSSTSTVGVETLH
eukprot:g4207.t1